MVKGPDFYTHHDRAMKALDYIHSTFEQNKLSPNVRFDNQTSRDRVHKGEAVN